MSTLKRRKLNQFLQNHPAGTVITSKHLADSGISNELARVYVASDWLTRIGRGAYIRTGDIVEWQGALFALQTQLQLPVHVGGLTAVRLKGFGHDLPLSGETVHLFSNGPQRLPDWFLQHNFGATIAYHRSTLFNLPAGASLSGMTYKGVTMQVSSPERAVFELLSLVKTNGDFDAARTLFEGFTSLRPREVQRMLEACRFVRIRRMFLWMAKECGHPWVKHLDASTVDLGAGKRVIYKNGRLDKELQITVPGNAGEDHV